MEKKRLIKGLKRLMKYVPHGGKVVLNRLEACMTYPTYLMSWSLPKDKEEDDEELEYLSRADKKRAEEKKGY